MLDKNLPGPEPCNKTATPRNMQSNDAERSIVTLAQQLETAMKLQQAQCAQLRKDANNEVKRAHEKCSKMLEDLNDELLLKRVAFDAQLDKEREAFEAEKAELALEKKNFTELQNKVATHAKAATNKVKLNVGGQLFLLSSDTLLKDEKSFFFAMLGCDQWAPDEDGTYFIDRDPTFFLKIVSFFRSGVWNLAGFSEEDKNLLQVELDYYQISKEFWPSRCLSRVSDEENESDEDESSPIISAHLLTPEDNKNSSDTVPARTIYSDNTPTRLRKCSKKSWSRINEEI